MRSRSRDFIQLGMLLSGPGIILAQRNNAMPKTALYLVPDRSQVGHNNITTRSHHGVKMLGQSKKPHQPSEQIYYVNARRRTKHENRDDEKCHDPAVRSPTPSVGGLGQPVEQRQPERWNGCVSGTTRTTAPITQECYRCADQQVAGGCIETIYLSHYLNFASFRQSFPFTY